MDNLPTESLNKNVGDDERKANYNLKKIKDNKCKLVRDRGDTNPMKNNFDRINTKIETNGNKTLIKSFSKTDKRDANTHDSERKSDKRFETKSKKTLNCNDEATKECSELRVETKTNDVVNLNQNKDRTSNSVNKKPLIKTVTDTDDATKKYKAVTFTEQKSQKSIEIKLPNFENIKRTKIPKIIDKNKNKIDNRIEEKVSTKRNTKFDKRFKHKREIASPTRSQDGGSPPTEIAKWSTGVSDHAKPYYEAWIKSTLAAISNKNERLYLEKQKLLKSFKKALEQRSKSPELFYENFADERFTGRIKVNHK